MVVRGPDSYRKVVRVDGGKRVLGGLRPGKYSLFPKPVADRLPISTKTTIRVTASKGTVARLYYSQSGTR